jgi:hypothetical protein
MIRKIPALAIATGLVLGGCLPNGKSDVRQPAKDSAVQPATFDNQNTPDGLIGVSARVIAPKRCRLSIATLSRPIKEPALNGQLWSVTDEGIVPLDQRQILEANGLRIGLVRGSLPAAVEAVMNPAPPQPKCEIVEIDQPDGEPTSIELAAVEGPTSLLLSRDGRAFGKDYDDAKGSLRVVASRDDAGGVLVKIVPEIRHGPMRDAYEAAPTVGVYQPKEFLRKRGQAEESFRDLSVSVHLKQGEILAIGGSSDKARGLGGFLFTKVDSKSDRVDQRVVLLWAKPAANTPAPGPNRGRFLGLFPNGDAPAPSTATSKRP